MEGAGQSRKSCSTCGETVDRDQRFCVFCGASLQADGGLPDNPPVDTQTPSTRSSNPTSSDKQSPDTFRRLVSGAYEKSKSTYEQANTQYRSYSESQAREREYREKLQSEERDHAVLISQFEDHRMFLTRARDGAMYFLDWWQAYESDEVGEEEAGCVGFLQTTSERARQELTKLEETEQELPASIHDGEMRKQLRSVLNGFRVRQENFEGSTSVFPPLLEVHRRIGSLERWRRLRAELELLVKDLEEKLDSPAVKTPVANRARFSDPSGQDSQANACPRCGLANSPNSAYCYECGANLSLVASRHSGTATLNNTRGAGEFSEPNVWILLSIAFSVVSLFLLPPVFGGLAIFFAFRAKQAGNEGGGIAMMVVAGACLLFGMLSGFLFWGF